MSFSDIELGAYNNHRVGLGGKQRWILVGGFDVNSTCSYICEHLVHPTHLLSEIFDLSIPSKSNPNGFSYEIATAPISWLPFADDPIYLLNQLTRLVKKIGRYRLFWKERPK